jgi:hypothetical protein
VMARAAEATRSGDREASPSRPRRRVHGLGPGALALNFPIQSRHISPQPPSRPLKLGESPFSRVWGVWQDDDCVRALRVRQRIFGGLAAPRAEFRAGLDIRYLSRSRNDRLCEAVIYAIQSAPMTVC